MLVSISNTLGTTLRSILSWIVWLPVLFSCSETENNMDSDCPYFTVWTVYVVCKNRLAQTLHVNCPSSTLSCVCLLKQVTNMVLWALLVWAWLYFWGSSKGAVLKCLPQNCCNQFILVYLKQMWNKFLQLTLIKLNTLFPIKYITKKVWEKKANPPLLLTSAWQASLLVPVLYVFNTM